MADDVRSWLVNYSSRLSPAEKRKAKRALSEDVAGNGNALEFLAKRFAKQVGGTHDGSAVAIDFRTLFRHPALREARDFREALAKLAEKVAGRKVGVRIESVGHSSKEIIERVNAARGRYGAANSKAFDERAATGLKQLRITFH